MASGVTPQNVIDAASRFVRSPGGIGSIPEGIASIGNAAVELAEVNAEADLAPAAVPLISSIAEALGLSVGWVILLAILAVLALLRILESSLIRICDAIPWGFGNGPKAFLTALFHPLDTAENWCIRQIVDGAESIISLVIQAAKYSFQLFFGQEVSSGGAPDSVAVRHMVAEINTLKLQYATVERELHHIDAELSVIPLSFTSGGPAPLPGVQAPAPGTYPSITQFNTLTHRVAAILNTLPTIIHDINVIESNQHQYSNDLNSLKNQLTGLEANLGQVRAIQISVHDTFAYLTSTVQRLEFDYGQLAPQVHAHTNQLHSMHPLEQLLFLGQAGLSNLKRLEQNPCQCPAYPGLSGDMAGALALYEFISNG